MPSTMHCLAAAVAFQQCRWVSTLLSSTPVLPLALHTFRRQHVTMYSCTHMSNHTITDGCEQLQH